MINGTEYNSIRRSGKCVKVLENSEAELIYNETTGEYIAIEKAVTYTNYGDCWHSTKGSFKRCKKAFEKYSPKSMAAIAG